MSICKVLSYNLHNNLAQNTRIVYAAVRSQIVIKIKNLTKCKQICENVKKKADYICFEVGVMYLLISKDPPFVEMKQECDGNSVQSL